MTDTHQARCPHCGTRLNINDWRPGQPQATVRCRACLRTFRGEDLLAGDPLPPAVDAEQPLDPLADTPDARAVAEAFLDHTAVRLARRDGRRIWALLSAGALLLLLAQYLLFHFDTLARSPQWRPVLLYTCQQLGCQLPAVSDVGQLRATDLLVRSDPIYQNTLRVDVLLHNDAAWPQAFPQLQLVFTDLNGKPVARRRFRPGEYLHGPVADRSLLPGNTPVHVSLRIVDPGRQAVGYQLDLRPAAASGPR